MSPCIVGLTTQDPYFQKEYTKIYKILKFRVNWANIEQDTAIQKLQNCWFSHDVTKIQTSEILILLRFYFHAV